MEIKDFIKYKSKEYNVHDIERKLLYDKTDAVRDAVHVFSVLVAKERSSTSLYIDPIRREFIEFLNIYNLQIVENYKYNALVLSWVVLLECEEFISTSMLQEISLRQRDGIIKELMKGFDYEIVNQESSQETWIDFPLSDSEQDLLKLNYTNPTEICNYIDDCLTNKIVAFEEHNTFYILGALWKAIPRSRKDLPKELSLLSTEVMMDKRFKEEHLPFTMLVNSSLPAE